MPDLPAAPKGLKGLPGAKPPAPTGPVPTKIAPVAAIHFRFEMEEVAPVLYVYDILVRPGCAAFSTGCAGAAAMRGSTQALGDGARASDRPAVCGPQVETAFQRKGLALFLMRMLELVARKQQMEWTMATVPETCEPVIKLLAKAGWTLDMESPSQVYPDRNKRPKELLGYEILSKCFLPKVSSGTAAAPRTRAGTGGSLAEPEKTPLPACAGDCGCPRPAADPQGRLGR